MSDTVFIHKLPATDAPWAYAIEFDFKQDFINALKTKIPRHARRWVPDKRVWQVKAHAIDWVCLLAICHVGRYVHVKEHDNAPDEAYAVLHLLPTAPPEVVTAAYKALAKLVHPDKVGTNATMQRINSAYASIKRDKA